MRRDALATLVKLDEARVERERARFAAALRATRAAAEARDHEASRLAAAAQAWRTRAVPAGHARAGELAASAAEGRRMAERHARIAAALDAAEAGLANARREEAGIRCEWLAAERRLLGVTARHRALLATRARALDAAEEDAREDLATSRWLRAGAQRIVKV